MPNVGDLLIDGLNNIGIVLAIYWSPEDDDHNLTCYWSDGTRSDVLLSDWLYIKNELCS